MTPTDLTPSNVLPFVPRVPCPAWCERDPIEHASEHRHDGPPSILPAGEVDQRWDGGWLFVRATQVIPRDGRRAPTLIEVEDAERTLTRLTPQQARALAEVLLVRAEEAEG